MTENKRILANVLFAFVVFSFCFCIVSTFQGFVFSKAALLAGSIGGTVGLFYASTQEDF